MGWLIFFAILVLLACLPLGAGLCYDEQGFAAVLLLGRVRIRLYPVPQWLDRLLHRPKKEKMPKELCLRLISLKKQEQRKASLLTEMLL